MREMATFWYVVMVVTGFTLLTSRVVAVTIGAPARTWVSLAFYFIGTCLAVNQLVQDIKQSQNNGLPK